MKSQCQIKGCNNPAQWALYRTNPDGEKLWLYVCRYHERIIGDENMGELTHLRRFLLKRALPRETEALGVFNHFS